jgi:hypothetical protein
MRPLSELVDNTDPGIVLIRQWIAAGANLCEMLPPSGDRADVLVRTQVTTRSTLGGIVYDTGGILIDHGWLRFIGSGHPKFTRNLPDWNANRAQGFLLVADDAVGGFFAINGGALGPDVKNVYYWAPDSLDWEPLGFGFTDFFVWTLSERLGEFYETLRWPTWREDVARITADQCFAFYPFLWSEEGSIEQSERSAIPITEAFGVRTTLMK